MGKIIVIEGTDSSGKETQSHLLLEHFLSLGRKARRLSFPNYESPACEPVKMYLAGEFGLNAEKVNPYPVSTMYAIDRYASYQKDWGYDYQQEESIFVADRYVTSNMIHQASKLEGKEKEEYLIGLETLEYKQFEIPRPDCIIFLDMPTKQAQELMKKRANKITREEEKDIHERNREYLEKSYRNACEIAEKYGWTRISCVDGDRIKSIQEIQNEILEKVREI